MYLSDGAETYEGMLVGKRPGTTDAWANTITVSGEIVDIGRAGCKVRTDTGFRLWIPPEELVAYEVKIDFDEETFQDLVLGG